MMLSSIIVMIMHVLCIYIYRYKVSSGHSLYIRETKVEDSGEYLCIASNIAGKRSAAAYLTVINTTLLNGE